LEGKNQTHVSERHYLTIRGELKDGVVGVKQMNIDDVEFQAVTLQVC